MVTYRISIAELDGRSFEVGGTRFQQSNNTHRNKYIDLVTRFGIIQQVKKKNTNSIKLSVHLISYKKHIIEIASIFIVYSDVASSQKEFCKDAACVLNSNGMVSCIHHVIM